MKRRLLRTRVEIIANSLKREVFNCIKTVKIKEKFWTNFSHQLEVVIV